MSRNPLYFFKSKHGVYLVRCSLPLSVHQEFGIQREIKVSLQTKSRLKADSLYPYVLQTLNALKQELLIAAMKKTEDTPSKMKDLLNQYKQKVKVDELEIANEEQSREIFDLNLKIKQQKQLLAEKDNTINALSISEPVIRYIPSSINLVEAIVVYFKFRKERMDWKPKTKKQRISYFKVFSNIVGQHTLISDLDRNAIDRYQKIVRRLPLNFSKKYSVPTDPNERPLFFDNLIASHEDELIGPGGVNSHFRTIRPFLEWCVENEHILKAHLHLLDVTAKELESAGKTRVCFTKEQLTSLYTSYIYSDILAMRENPKPFHFWLPLMGLFTGARVNEIAQLLVSDIMHEEGVYYININDDAPHKSVKNKQSKRRIPIAQVILDAGFLSFVQSREGDVDERIFNELPSHRDGYGREVSRWFNDNYKQKCNIIAKEKEQLVFHSLRHTFINALSSTLIDNHPVESRIIYELVGHETGKVTHSTYGHGHSIPVLKQAIDCIDFGISFEHICFDKFKSRTKPTRGK